MLARWLWQLPLESNTLWHKVVASKYEPHPFECQRTFLMSSPLSSLLFGVWLARVRVHISRKICLWRIVLYDLCSPTYIIYPLKSFCFFISCFCHGACFSFPSYLVALLPIGKRLMSISLVMVGGGQLQTTEKGFACLGSRPSRRFPL